MRTSTCLLPKVQFLLVVGVALMVCQVQSSFAQQDGGVVPAAFQGSSSFFHRQLGTALRATYHTQGYGTQDDVFSIGGMKVMTLDDVSTMFIDGQGTLSDDFGGGFNFGVGYRQLTNSTSPIMSFDPERIIGFGFWTDGQSTSSDNFFTQLGFSLESLGESFDTRLTGYFPLERNEVSDPTIASFSTPTFQGNNLFSGTESFTIDTALTVIDSEVAKRLGDLDAWAFIGGYHLDGGPIDTQGYRAGVRGYAVPDLSLSLQVTDDNLYKTNVMFGITWFIGRTHRGNAPCGTIMDRMREPVLRNDFIAITSESGTRVSGDALTLQGTTDLVDIVHVDSSAAAGGDGTFENPYNDLATATASRDDVIVLAHGGSSFSGQATLRTNQELVGEGLDADGNAVVHTVATSELGVINLPETAAGAQSLAQITIDGQGGTALTMADGASVDNFRITNSATGVSANGVSAPTSSMLANLEIDAPTSRGVVLQNVTGAVVVENTVEINQVAAGGEAFEINGGDEAVTVAATINDSLGRSLAVRNRAGGTVGYTGLIDDDANVANNSQGIVIEDNADATVNLTNTLDVNITGTSVGALVQNNTNTIVNASSAVDLNAAGTGNALSIAGNNDASSITFADLDATATSSSNAVDIRGGGTVDINSVGATRGITSTGSGNAFVNAEGTVADDNTAAITVGSNISNSGGGRVVAVTDRRANDLTFDGTVTDTDGAGSGLLVQDNDAGNIIFTDTTTVTTAGLNNAVDVLSNTGATVSFFGLDLDTTAGVGFNASGGGTLAATGTNSIDTATGVGLNLVGMTIDAANVMFDTVNVTSGVTNGINLASLDGTGQVVVGGGTTVGDGGTLTTAGTAVIVNDAANVSMSNLDINNVGIARGVNVSNQTAGSTATFTGFDITTVNGDAVDVSGNTAGTVTFDTLTAATSGTGDGVDISNADSSTTAVNITSVTVDATGTGRGFAATGGGVITVAGTNAIDSAGGIAFDVDDVENLTASNVTINNTTAQGVRVTNQDNAADTVALTNFNVTTTTSDAVTVQNNTAGNVTFNTLQTTSTTGDGLVVEINTGATVAVNGMNIDATGTGQGVRVTGGGTFTTAGTNTIDTVDGVGLTIADMDSATVNNLTVNSTNVDAVDISHSVVGDSVVTFNNVNVASAGANGIDVLADGGGEFDLVMDDVTINNVGQDGVVFDTGANADRVDLTLTNSTITAATGAAFLATLNDSNTADVRFVLEDNQLTTSSAVDAALDISVTSSLSLNARIGSVILDENDPAAPIGDNNRFVNSAAGNAVQIEINDPAGTGVINLDLRDNTAQGGVGYTLTQTNGDFNLVDAVDTIAETNNVGSVLDNGVINSIVPPVLAPTP